MAKVRAPLLSFGASGQIGGSQVYASWKGRAYARELVTPANPRSAEQTITRSLFSWLNQVYKFAPSAMTEAWAAYAAGQVMTDRNGFIKINLPDMRDEVDVNNFVFSPGARSGIAAAAIVATGGNDQITVDITAPALPSGWTIVEAIAAAIRQQDPQTDDLYTITAGTDATSTYQVVLTGLANAQEYLVGAWFKYLRPDGLNAYGRAISALETTT